MLRRSIGFVLTVVVCFAAGYQLAWAKDLRERILDNPAQSVGLLVLGLILISLLVWSHVSPRPWKVTLAFLLGVAVAAWGRDLLKGIGWEQLIFFFVCLVALFVFWTFTVLDHLPRWGWLTRTRQRLTPAPSASSNDAGVA